MPIEISRLVSDIKPNRTVLLFGAGSSLPSGGPKTSEIVEHLSDKFSIGSKDFSLAEISGLVQDRLSRGQLVKEVRTLFKSIKPSGSLVNLPLYDWKNIYTTNYDELIELSYEKRGRSLSVYSSNFDFTVHEIPEATKLFKIHGTLSQDISNGHQTRMVLTEEDNDNVHEYREALYDQLKCDLNNSHLVIIGQSLADSDLKRIIDRALEISKRVQDGSRISLFMYERDEERASLFEKRGINVCFGGIDDFFCEIAARSEESVHTYTLSDNPLDRASALRPVTEEVDELLDPSKADIVPMFNGLPASYANINRNLTFRRDIAAQIESCLLSESHLCATLIGASGVGKTTAARQTMLYLRDKGYICWEHKPDHTLLYDKWVTIARYLKSEKRFGALLIDDAHEHLFELSKLVDLLATDKNYYLKLIVVSSRNHWDHRVKSSYMFQSGEEFELKKLQGDEINRLIDLVETNTRFQTLIDASFGGFSRSEKRRRLIDRCESDTFVCLKNIFASERFDDIILREYAELDSEYQDIYKFVAAMENAGVRVHRQLVLRLLGINNTSVAGILGRLSGIIEEYSISEREGIYGWKGRHPVIVDIVARHKFSNIEKIKELFENVLDNISPTFEIEIRTIRQLCNLESGISRIPDKTIQNRLLQKMISKAPGERVARHRLIRNLIDMDEFEKAETEIRLFEKDLRIDGPVFRHKIRLKLARASNTIGIMEEDRLAIIEQAENMAKNGIKKYPDNKNILRTYCDVGLEYYRRTGDFSKYDDAITEMKNAEIRIGDPDITKSISTFEKKFSRYTPRLSA